MPRRDYKVVRVTSKRQLTIPKAYYDELRIGEEVKCYLEGDRLVVEPLRADPFWDFSTDILRELVDEGYSGENLLAEFTKRKQAAAEALGRLVEEARGEVEAGKGRPAGEVFDELLGDRDA